MVFHWDLSDSKSQVSRILLSILTDLNSIVVWMVSTRHLIPKSYSPCNNSSVTVPRVPITNGIKVTFMFHSLFFFHFPSKVEVLILPFMFFQFYSVVSRDNKVHNFASTLLFFLLMIMRSGRLAKYYYYHYYYYHIRCCRNIFYALNCHLQVKLGKR